MQQHLSYISSNIIGTVPIWSYCGEDIWELLEMLLAGKDVNKGIDVSYFLFLL